MTGLPGGTVTFLVTDIEGSTRLLQSLGDAVYSAALAEHQRLLRAAFVACGGREFGTHGDGFIVAFPRATDAVAAAVAAQRTLLSHRWQPGMTLLVRMGIHTGEPTSVTGDYVGLDVHRAVRVCASGYGGQILLSGTTAALIEGALPNGVTLRPLGRHRLKDLEQPEQLFQVLHQDLPAQFPRLRSLNPVTNNLPRPLTRFIGREGALATVESLLSANRLVTLAGAGGCGKTRVAFEVARRKLETYADGVWLVELDALADPVLVPRRVAATLNVPETPDRPPDAAVAAAIADRHLLLILDNCEHLLAACASLVEVVLRACPSVRILTTSREPLGVPGETVWRVPSLTLPQPHQSFDEMAHCESVGLFVERATAVAAKFALAERNAQAVTAICRRLDGIPLAIELAAARVQALSVEQIAARLDDRFRLLAHGSRTALPRQQTLRAAIDWSHDLLTDAERIMLRRLSVFAGGWTLEAAEAVCGGDGIEASSAVDVMTQIVFKSLATMDDAGGDAWYRLPETVRHYGRERLAEAGETATVRSRHLSWYAGRAERAAPELFRPDQTMWFDRLEREHDNVRSALEWALTDGDVEAGLRLAGAIWRFWYVRGYFVEGRALLDALLERGAPTSQGARATALVGDGSLAVYGLGDYAAGCARLEDALRIYRSLGNDHEAAVVLKVLGVAAFSQGEFDRARDLYEQSLTIHRALGDQLGTALCLHNLGRLAHHRGEYQKARDLIETSLGIFRGLSHQPEIAAALINLGPPVIELGDHESARRYLLEALAIEQQVGDARMIGYLVDSAARLAAAQGHLVEAARLFAAAHALRESIHVSLPRADLGERDRWVDRVRGGLAPVAFSDAWAEGCAMTIHEAILAARGVVDEDGGAMKVRRDDKGGNLCVSS
jgi:predicted ATPase/class 3 adenylate cyclase/Tfp pilus assembly protein PilF